MVRTVVCSIEHQELIEKLETLVRPFLSPLSSSHSLFVISFLFFLLLIDATNTIIGPNFLQLCMACFQIWEQAPRACDMSLLFTFKELI